MRGDAATPGPLSATALLPELLQRRLCAALVPPGAVHQSRTRREFADDVHRGRGDVAVFEPGLAVDRNAHRGEPPHGVIEGDSTPLVAYVLPTRASVQAALAFVRIVPVIVADHDDTPAALRERLDIARAASAGCLLCEMLGARLERLPSPVAAGIAAQCVSAARHDSVARLAARCGVSSAELSRCCTRVGLARPHRIVLAGRLARAYPSLVGVDTTAIDAARATGVASARALDRELRMLLSVSLDQLRRFPPTAAAFATALARVVVTPERADVVA